MGVFMKNRWQTALVFACIVKGILIPETPALAAAVTVVNNTGDKIFVQACIKPDNELIKQLYGFFNGSVPSWKWETLTLGKDDNILDWNLFDFWFWHFCESGGVMAEVGQKSNIVAHQFSATPSGLKHSVKIECTADPDCSPGSKPTRPTPQVPHPGCHKCTFSFW